MDLAEDDDPELANPTQTFLAVAGAELRTARRLVRTWVFAILAICITLALFGFYAWLEGMYSTSAIGRFGTRFEVGEFGGYLLATMSLTLVFLALDVPKRDEHDRIVDVVDSRPFANVVLVGGQVAGLTLTVWLPMILALALVQAFGMFARTFGWWMGDTIEPYSLVALATIDAIPVLVLCSSFVLLLVVALGNRLLAALTALFVIGWIGWVIPDVPAYLVEALVPVSNYASHASDLAPRFASANVLFQRGALLLFAAGLVVFAAVWHPRVDGSSRLRQVLVAATCAALGGVGIGSLVVQAVGGMQQREAWLAAHTRAAQQEASTRVDVIRLHGNAGISPGRRLDIDLAITFEAPQELTAMVFSFNPGMRITSLALGGVEAPFSHRDGLLTVELPAPMLAGATSVLSMHAAGVPNPRFGHLDGAVDPWRVPARNALSALGREAAIFERSYVGLMPAVHWLPASGANVDRDDPARRARDFYIVDLTVDVPEGWLVASVGGRHAAVGGAFRIASEVPVAEVPLFASRFERRAIVVDGIVVELLAHPEHFRGFRSYDIEGALIDDLERVHQDLRNLGLGFPLPSISFVEVPTRLRTFRGGWLLDGESGLPGVVPLKENGLPMVRPEHRYLVSRNRRSDQVDAEEKLFQLRNISRNLDAMAGGGGIVTGFVGSLLATTGATGEGAVALDWICRYLAYGLVEPQVYYVEGLKSAHNFDTIEGRGTALAGMLSFLVLQDRRPLFRRGRVFVDRPQVWDRALGNPLWGLETDRDPAGAAHALGLKGTRIAFGLRDGLGRHGTARLLAGLRERFRGRSYRWSDLVALGESVGAPPDGLLGDWLRDSAAPGFLVSAARVGRLADDQTDRLRYLSRVHVRNDEPVGGAVFLGTDRQAWGERADPVRVDPHTSVEVSIVTDEPPSQLWLHSYFSLNRLPVRLEIVDADDVSEMSRSFVPARPSGWIPTVAGIVVDDLDPGFSVETDGDVATREGLWGAYRWGMEFDQGLPWWYWGNLEGRLNGVWSREAVYSSWGKYRHTMARATSGSGKRRAVFTTKLPNAGRWRLDMHIPGDPVPQMPDMDYVWPPYTTFLGRYDMWLRTPEGETAIEFDGSGAAGGWNDLGVFDLESPRVSVVVSNRTDGAVVIADAIRWLQVPGSG
ncbi:MAG: hypothetical protein OXK76_18390 [Gammaproteobacteria bacterium]|nr:hypothetical protein [Gammaproteobacteria bacterium]